MATRRSVEFKDHDVIEILEHSYKHLGRINTGFVFKTHKTFTKVYETRYQEYCSECSNCLVPEYTYIIKKLKDAGLIDENKKLLCCDCHDKNS